MLQTVPAANITLRSLKQSFNLKVASNAQFFTEWQVETAPLSEIEQIYLDRVRGNFLDLLEEPAVLENSVKNSVKMVVLAPLLDLAGFYRRPFRITTETSIEINLEDEGLCIPSLILAMNSLRFWPFSNIWQSSSLVPSCFLSTLFPMLYLKNVAYHPPASPQPILKNLNLQLDAQQLGLIVGISGAGKTTLLEILAGLVEVSVGEVYWRDQCLTPLHLQQLGGLVFQFPERHFCGSTIAEELRLGHPEIKTEQIQQALKEVGLDHLTLNTNPFNLSGGQQRRLALAVQLIRQPYLLLLDEPTAGLDWSMRSQLVNLLKRLKEHWTLLIVTHDASELRTIADRVWRLVEGKLEPI